LQDLRVRQNLFKVPSTQQGREARLSLSGEIDLSTKSLLEGWLSAAEQVVHPEIIVDLAEVTFMDAGGLRAFLGAADRVRRSGGGFHIVNVSPAVRRLLDITKTSHLLCDDLPGVTPAPGRRILQVVPGP